MATDPPRTAVHPPSALPIGTRLFEFEVTGVLGVGGFGIVYLAFDHDLEREVAVKEYMPQSLADRTATLHVSLRSNGDAETFNLGRESFVKEARMLAQFNHPSLLKVHRFWEGNGTAYMAMPVYRGSTLRDLRRAALEPFDEARVRALLDPLLGALATLHEAHVYHRDIAPDNILVEADGRPVLLDFGAARRVISDQSHNLTAILKPAYAPIEQYAEAGSVKQGPWTDIYALGATVHFLLLGRPPSPATARAINDDQPPLSAQALPGCSEAFLHVIDWMLAPRPADRPQSVAALREVLEGRAPPPVRRVQAPEASSQWETTQRVAPVRVAPAAPPHDVEGTIVLPRPPDDADAPTVVVAHPVPPAAARAAQAPLPASATAPTVPPAQGARRSPAVIGFAALGAVVVAAAAYALWPKPAELSPAEAAAASAAPAASAVASSASAASAASAVEAAAAATGPAPASAPASSGGPAAASTVEAAAVVAAVARAPASVPASKPVVKHTKPASAPVLRAPPPRVVETVEPVVVAPAPPPPLASRASTPTPVSAPASVAAPLGPREACGRRVLLALWICMENACEKPALRNHPECVDWRMQAQHKGNP